MKISEHATMAAKKLDALAMATADTNDSCAPIIQAAIDAATKDLIGLTKRFIAVSGHPPNMCLKYGCGNCYEYHAAKKALEAAMQEIEDEKV